MINPSSDHVYVLAPSENDSAVASRILQDAGLAAFGTRDIQSLCAEIKNGCAVIVVAEEALSIDQLPHLQRVLQAQEPWSDIPLILMTGQSSERSWESFSASGNISILERPFSRLTLVRAVEVGVRSRKKQYQVRQLLEDQRMAAQKRDDFFAALSHELRTPLSVILGWSEILLSGELTREAQVDALKILDRNARLQKSLIDDLLDTSRIITGKLHFETRPLSLVRLIQSAHVAFALRAAEKNITISLSVPDNSCVVLGDEPRLMQAFSNLLTNSIKFTPDLGSIELSVRASGDEFTVSVKDTGHGIDPEFLPYVFDRLKQEDMSTTRSHGGLGLGLAITSHIVEQHNGTIGVTSEGRGKGAEFSISIPAYHTISESPAAPKEETPKASSLEGIRILVVDDSPDILQLINIWLKKAKAEVKLTSSAAEALKELPVFRPTVFISDIGMPDIDGYELISRVRVHPDPAVRNVKAVALTAYAKDEEKARALESGFQLHISKPLSSSHLLTTLASLAPAPR